MPNVVNQPFDTTQRHIDRQQAEIRAINQQEQAERAAASEPARLSLRQRLRRLFR